MKAPLTEPCLGAAPSESEKGELSPSRLSNMSVDARDDPYGFFSDDEDLMDDHMIRKGLAFSPGLDHSPKALPAAYDPYLDSLESPPCRAMSLSPLGGTGQFQKVGVSKHVATRWFLKSTFCISWPVVVQKIHHIQLPWQDLEARASLTTPSSTTSTRTNTSATSEVGSLIPPAQPSLHYPIGKLLELQHISF